MNKALLLPALVVALACSDVTAPTGGLDNRCFELNPKVGVFTFAFQGDTITDQDLTAESRMRLCFEGEKEFSGHALLRFDRWITPLVNGQPFVLNGVCEIDGCVPERFAGFYTYNELSGDVWLWVIRPTNSQRWFDSNYLNRPAFALVPGALSVEEDGGSGGYVHIELAEQ